MNRLIVGVVAVLEVAPYIEVSRRHVLPVVWLWVLGVVVVEFGALVHRVFAKQRRSELHLVVDVPIPCSDSRRCKVVYDTRVALVTVLITPVWVVIVVVGKPVSLICRCSLSTSFGRVTPGREAQ